MRWSAKPRTMRARATCYLSEAEYDRLLKAARVSGWRKLHVLIKLAVTTDCWRRLKTDRQLVSIQPAPTTQYLKVSVALRF